MDITYERKERMLLEIGVWGSQQWYEEAMPFLEKKGFELLEDQEGNTEGSDGEFMKFYYDYNHDPLSVDDLRHLLEDLKRILAPSLTPPPKVFLVKSPR